MMFQDARLLPWKTVIDNVGLGLKAHGATPPCRRWPASDLKAAHRSGRPRCRWAEAARCAGPRADPSPAPAAAGRTAGALDALTRLEMQELIVSLWQEHGFTVLLVTHDVSEAVAMADRVLLKRRRLASI